MFAKNTWFTKIQYCQLDIREQSRLLKAFKLWYFFFFKYWIRETCDIFCVFTVYVREAFVDYHTSFFQ